jgi:surface antigen
MANATGMYMPVTGHAYQFAGQASVGGWTVGTTPAINSVAVFPAGSFGSSVGHVGWVVQVSGSQLRIQDYNWNFTGAVVSDHWVTPPAGTRYIYSDR